MGYRCNSGERGVNKKLKKLLSPCSSIRMFPVRVLDSLHHELLDEAQKEGFSLNQLCLSTLARPLDG